MSKVRNLMMKKNVSPTSTSRDQKSPENDLSRTISPAAASGDLSALLDPISLDPRSLDPSTPWGPLGNTVTISGGGEKPPPIQRLDDEHERLKRNPSLRSKESNNRPRAKDYRQRSVSRAARYSSEDESRKGSDHGSLSPNQIVDNGNDSSKESKAESASRRERALERRLRASQENEERLFAKMRQLDEQLQEQTQRCKELDRALKKSNNALSRLQQQEPYEMISDLTLQELYEGLVSDVQSWAGNYCRYGVMRVVDAKVQVLQALSPSYATYLHEETLRPYLLQSLVMRLLVRHVLNFDCDGGLWWAGALCKPVQKLQTELLPIELFAKSLGEMQLSEIREYARWKAKTAVLVENVASKSAVNTWIKRLVSKFKQDLYMYVPASSADVWVDLKEIVGKAVKLDELMTKSRALFTVSHWEGEQFAWMKFDQATMEAVTGSTAVRPGMLVDLVLAPALVRRGTSDGDAYDQTTTVTKWRVICRESRQR